MSAFGSMFVAAVSRIVEGGYLVQGASQLAAMSGISIKERTATWQKDPIEASPLTGAS
jgi:hypothetical protein